MPMASARSESCDPILPYPTMPSVSPRTSCAPAADLFQTPLCIWVEAKNVRRSRRMISPMASSATERELECGSLNTAMPRSLAALRSILSTPIQNAPTATNLVGSVSIVGAPLLPGVGRSGFFPVDEQAASITAALTLVFERTPSTETPRIFSINSRSSSAALWDSTSYPAERNCSTATALMFSSNRTFKKPPECFGSAQRLSQTRREGAAATTENRDHCRQSGVMAVSFYCSASPCRLSVQQTSRLQPLMATGLEFRTAVFLPTSSLLCANANASTQGRSLLLGSRVAITK